MQIYHNLNDDLKPIFITKIVQLLFLITCNVYCAYIILSCLTKIECMSYFLMGILALNTVSIVDVIVDLWVKVRYNKRRNNPWIFDLIFCGTIFVVVIVYYIITGARVYRSSMYEFIVILSYSIICVIIIEFMLVCLCGWLYDQGKEYVLKHKGKLISV